MEFKGTKGKWNIVSRRPMKQYGIGNENATVCNTTVWPGVGGEVEAYHNAILIAYSKDFLNAFEDALTGLEWKYENDIKNFDKADDEKLNEWRQLMREFKRALAKNV